MRIEDIKLKKGMTKEEVNELISEWLLLEDEVYMGNNYKHNWRCKCGDIIESRMWATVRKGFADCGCVLYNNQEQRYKYEVEKDGEYEYIRSFRKEDMLPNGKIVGDYPYLQIKHKYCGSIYDIGASNFINGGIRCSKCCGSYENSLEYNYPEVAKMIFSDENANKVDTKTISKCGGEKFYFKCDKCGEVATLPKRLNSVIHQGFSCKYCSDGISVPEKFMSNILKQLNIEHVKEFTRLNVNLINGKKIYDFYIPTLNMIIETHGMQHYGNSSFERTLKEERENDRIKKELALSNGVNHYIEIDCRYSKLEWLKDNINKELSPYFDLSSIDWNLAWEESQNSICVKTWELWNSGKTTSKISKILNISGSSINRYLKIGSKLNKCIYCKQESIKRSYARNHMLSKNVMCITTKKIFNTITDAAKYYNTGTGHISNCCKGKRKSSGKLYDGTPLVWRYLKVYHNRKYRSNEMYRLHSKQIGNITA